MVAWISTFRTGELMRRNVLVDSDEVRDVTDRFQVGLEDALRLLCGGTLVIAKPVSEPAAKEPFPIEVDPALVAGFAIRDEDGYTKVFKGI